MLERSEFPAGGQTYRTPLFGLSFFALINKLLLRIILPESVYICTKNITQYIDSEEYRAARKDM